MFQLGVVTDFSVKSNPGLYSGEAYSLQMGIATERVLP